MENDLYNIKLDEPENFNDSLNKYINSRSFDEIAKMESLRDEAFDKYMMSGEDMVISATYCELDERHRNLFVFVKFFSIVAIFLFPAGAIGNLSGWWMATAFLGFVPFVNQFFWVLDIIFNKSLSGIGIVSACFCAIFFIYGFWKNYQIFKVRKRFKALINAWKLVWARNYWSKKMNQERQNAAYYGGL